MSLYKRLIAGCFLLVVLVTAVSFLVRDSFLKIAALESHVRVAEQSVAAMEAAQAALAQEDILAAETTMQGEEAFLRFKKQAKITQNLLLAAAKSAHNFDPAIQFDSLLREHEEIIQRRSIASMRIENLRDRQIVHIEQQWSDAVQQIQARRNTVVHGLHGREDDLRARLITFCGLSILAALIIAIFTVTSLIMPLRRTAHSAQQIGGGDLQHRVEWRSNDDLGIIAAEINRLAVRLRDLRETESGRRQMDQQLSDAVVQSIFEPVIVTDSKGHVLKLNRAAEEVLGEASEDRNALANTPGGERILSAIRAAVSMQQAVTGEEEAAILPMRIGEAERSYRLRTTAMRDLHGRLLGAVTLLEDVTALTEVDRFKTRFLNVASQKLQEPLQHLRLALYTLTRGYAGKLNELQMDIAHRGEHEAEKLDDIMTDLMEVAELDTGRRELRAEKLRPYYALQDAAARHRAQAQAKEIRLTVKAFEDLPYVSADRRALRTILDNLILNALRYTPKSGEIRLEAIELPDRVQFFVVDNGRGIEAERLPSIFDRFSGTGTAGTGMGLALVRRLVESQGGQVAVESRLDHGSNFNFTLPIAASTATRHPVEAG